MQQHSRRRSQPQLTTKLSHLLEVPGGFLAVYYISVDLDFDSAEEFGVMIDKAAESNREREVGGETMHICSEERSYELGI